MKFGEDLFNNELRPAPSVAAISRSVRSSITAHSANDRFAPGAAIPQPLIIRTRALSAGIEEICRASAKKSRKSE